MPPKGASRVLISIWNEYVPNGAEVLNDQRMPGIKLCGVVDCFVWVTTNVGRGGIGVTS